MNARVVSVALAVLAVGAVAWWALTPDEPAKVEPRAPQASALRKGTLDFMVVPICNDRFVGEPCSLVAGGGLKLVPLAMERLRAERSGTIGLFMGDMTQSTGEIARPVLAFHYAEVLSRAGMAFAAAGEGELGAGSAFLRDTLTHQDQPMLLCGNATDPAGNALCHGWNLAQWNGRGVAIVAVAAESLEADLAARGSDVRLVPAAPTAEAALREVREHGAKIGVPVEVALLLFHGTMEEAQALLRKVPGFTFAVAAHGGPLPERETRTVGATRLLSPGESMRFFLQVGVTQEDRVVSTEKRLSEQLAALQKAEPPEFEFFRREMKERVFPLAVQNPSGRPRDPRGSYVGAATCAECHAKQAQEHRASAHGVPSALLGRSDYVASTGCIACHTTAPYFEGGWTGPGVVTADPATKEGRFEERPPTEFAAVSCEACHGPGGTHVVEKKPGWGRVEFSRCVQCHLPDRGEFDAAAIWRKSGHRATR